MDLSSTIFRNFARKQREEENREREIYERKRSRDYSPIETLTLNYNDGLSVLHNGTADAQISTFNCFLIIIINRARSRACRASWLMVVVVGPYPRRRLYNRPVGQRRLVA